MKVRSITCFFNPANGEGLDSLNRLADLAVDAKRRFEESGYPVQSARLATPPFPFFCQDLTLGNVIQLAQELESAADRQGFAYVSMGPALPDCPQSYQVIPDVLSATQNVFLSGEIANAKTGVSLSAVKACAQVITRTARFSKDGFTNLRFAALANVLPGGPFFPAAYHQGEELAFALAMEAADVAVSAFSGAESIATGRQRLLERLECGASELGSLADQLTKRYEVHFLGFDFSLAPFPDQLCSLGKAMELIGAPRVGMSGSLAAAAILADTLDQGNWLRTGFNGMMLPVLEDATLAARSADGSLMVKDLLLYSAVCGTGLDTVPLPGDVSPEQVAALLLDLAALAIRLGKPLTARLMPVPGKHAGEVTEFHFDYFINGKVMALPSEPLHGVLIGDESVPIAPRRSQ